MKLKLKRKVEKIIKSNSFITLFSTTLGVLLALYLSNLNTKHSTEIKKTQAIKNLKTEISNNEKILNDSNENDRLFNFLEKVNEIDNKFGDKLKTDRKSIHKITKEYPEFLKILDSTQTDNDEYYYHVEYEIEFTLDNLQSIAWETSKMSNITNEFSYDCLSPLVQNYELLELYTIEQNKLLNHIIDSDFSVLHSRLSIIKQLKISLLDIIIETKKEIKNCG